MSDPKIVGELDLSKKTSGIEPSTSKEAAMADGPGCYWNGMHYPEGSVICAQGTKLYCRCLPEFAGGCFWEPEGPC